MGRSAIGVVRISGYQSRYIFKTLTKNTAEPIPRVAAVRSLYCPNSGVQLDKALTLFFQAPHTYTGEDILELHLHGGTAIIQAMLKAIRDLHKPEDDIFIRYAENGEFSRRGFINGKYDLMEIEGIREMIDAETESQRLASLASVDGTTSNLFKSWRQEIAKNIALLTTVIDFGEDHDIDEVSELFAQVSTNIKKLEHEIKQYLHNAERSQVLLKGIRLSLLGPPNAGKSSLLNRLASKDAAIVSDIAGTTRDILDIPMDINGYKTVIGDTAGIRSLDDADTIEIEGIKRAKNASITADLVILVLPVDDPAIDSSFLDHIAQLKQLNKKMLVVFNKCDLTTKAEDETLLSQMSVKLGIEESHFWFISCNTGEGVPQLASALTNEFQNLSTQDPVIISSRSRDLLVNDVLYGFDEFQYWKDNDDVVLATESLRQSVEGIGKVTGEAVGVEEVLGIVFSSFCIGK